MDTSIGRKADLCLTVIRGFLSVSAPTSAILVARSCWCLRIRASRIWSEWLVASSRSRSGAATGPALCLTEALVI
jgi:hypothetical protein